MAKSVGNFPPPVECPQAAIRWPDHLRTESSWRVQLLSVPGSWKALVSALRTFSLFCQSTQPHLPHFPVTTATLGAWAASFRNGGAFGKYVMHLRTACRLLGCDPPQHLASAALSRGLRKITAGRPRSSLPASLVIAAIRRAIDGDFVVQARLWAVARHFLLRVESELFPMQVNGRSGLHPDDMGWHSVLEFGTGPPSVTITFRRRKADPKGAQVKRSCVCESQHRLL